MSENPYTSIGAWTILSTKFGNMEDNFNKVFSVLNERIEKMLSIDITKLEKEDLRAHLKKAIL